MKNTEMTPTAERITYDCHRCRSFDLPYWCCPYCHRTLLRSNPETRAFVRQFVYGEEPK